MESTKTRRIADLDRDGLIDLHLPLVRHIAGRMALRGRVPAVAFEDLLSVGTLGLIEAIDRFDWSRGTPFHCYAYPRIRGAMLDMLRQLDGMPRSIRHQARALDDERQKLTGLLEREPTARELCGQLGWSVKRFDHVSRLMGQVEISLHEFRPSESESGETWADSLVDSASEGQMRQLEISEAVNELRAALRKLPERERNILRLTFFDERKTTDVALALGISPTRVFQLRRRSLSRLRCTLAHQEAA